MTDFPRTIYLGYALAGAVLGALWVAQSGVPLWEHGLRLIVLMAVVMGVMTVLRKRSGRGHGNHAVTRFLIAKVGLVALAMIATVLLEEWVADPDPWIGVGLFTLVAVGGPLLHPWFAPARTAGLTR